MSTQQQTLAYHLIINLEDLVALVKQAYEQSGSVPKLLKV